MDEITQDINPPQTKRDLTSPLSPKRPRTDNRESRFDFPYFLKFRKTIGSASSTSMLQKAVDPGCTGECGDTEDEKPHEQQDTKLTPPFITKLITSHTGDAHTGSSKACFITAERGFLLPLKDEQPPVTESDKLSSYPVDVAGGALAESHTLKDASADRSSHPDCKRLRESLVDETLGGCNLPTGNDEDGTQVQNRVSQIQAFIHSSSDGDVRCRSDCTHEHMLHNTGFCNTWSQSAEVKDSSQKRDEHGLNENTLFSKDKEEGTSPISSTDYADTKSFNSNPGEEPSGSLEESIRSEEKILKLQYCENENVAACDWETKGQVNENGLSNNSSVECAEGSIVSYNVVLARNIAFETEADDICGARGELPAGKMIAKARSETADHTTETPVPARISQEPAEGDNDAGPLSVIDPAIWSKTDREAEEKRCNSGSTAGAKLFPSVKVCEMEMPLQLCSDVGPSQEDSALLQSWQLDHQSRTQQCKDEKEDLCHSYTEPQACSITTNKTQSTGNEGSCLWKSSSSSSPKLPPAGNGRQESHDTVGRWLKKQDQFVFFSVSLDQLKALEVECLQAEIARTDGATEVKEKAVITCFEEEEIRTEREHGNSENSVDLVERHLQQNEKHKDNITEKSAGDCINGWAAGEISKHGNKLTHSDQKLGNNLHCLFDHPYSAVISIMERTTEKNERKEEASVGEETDVQGNSEILVTSKDGHQQQCPQKGDMTEVSLDDSISEWTEDNISKSSNILIQVSHHEDRNKLHCFSDYQHKAETLVAENKEDIVAFTFPLTSDAVVPGPHELIPSQNTDNNPTGLNCSDRFSPVPSAVIFCDRVLRGLDTFKKIQLSPDDNDGDDDAGLSNSPLFTSLLGQMLKTSQRQLYHPLPEAESKKDEEVPEGEAEGEGEEEVERFECHTEIMANGLLSSDYTSNELQNFISTADVTALGWLEQQLNSEPACNSSECFQDDLNPQSLSSTVPSQSDCPASDVNDSPKLERKKQFDMVMKELNLYFDISMSDFSSDSRASSPEQCSDVTEALKEDTSNCKQFSSPRLEGHRDASSDDADEDHSMDMCRSDPVASCTPGSCDSEQEVPPSSHVCQEASMYTAAKHRDPQEMEQKRRTWSLSYMCQPFLEQLSHMQPRRLEPLRTCTRPIRVGLSKRAKTRHLHRPHPYK